MFVGDAVLVTFLIHYLRRSALAWLVIPLFGVVFLVEAPSVFFITPSRYPLRVRVLSFCMAAGFGIAAIAYGFVVRRKYKLYLQEPDAPTQSI
jgi:hypothetical protein